MMETASDSRSVLDLLILSGSAAIVDCIACGGAASAGMISRPGNSGCREQSRSLRLVREAGAQKARRVMEAMTKVVKLDIQGLKQACDGR